jgi:hypothetical protein
MPVVEPEPQENPGEVKEKIYSKTPKENTTSRRGSDSGSTGIIHTRIYRTDDREAD